MLPDKLMFFIDPPYKLNVDQHILFLISKKAYMALC